MRRWRSPAAAVTMLLTIAVTSGQSSGTASAATSATSVADLAAQIRTELRGSTAGSVAYRVNIAGVGHVAHRWRAESAPASNQKVFTAISSLDQLGAGFRYRTVVTTGGTVQGHVLKGNLVIRGSGDPTLRTRHLRALADDLRDDGLRRVTGHLVVDDSRYRGRSSAPGWKDGWVRDESGPVAAFTVDKNAWRSDSPYLRDPATYNARIWRQVLAEKGIAVEESTVLRDANSAATRLTAHRSRSLAAIWRRALPLSDNFTAEMVLREIGAARGEGSRRGGVRGIRAEARDLGVPLGDVVDGSGLSPYNHASPRILVRWLRAARTLDAYPAFYAALPVSCEDGTTLEGRMCGPRVAGRVHAKTGTLMHERTLSGYATTRSGHRVTFSVLLSQVRDLTAARQHMDAAVAAVVRSDFG